MRNRCLPNLFGRAAHTRLFVLAVFALTASFAEAAAEFVENLKAGRRQKIVCYGTSLTVSSHWWVDGLAAALEARWPGQAIVVNAGLSGKNSATGLSLVQSKVVAAEPDAVLIEFSMNDAADSLNSGKTPAEALAAAEANLKAIIAAVRSARPAAEIILQTMNPYVAVAGSGLSNRTDLEAHFAMYRRVAAEGGHLLIDSAPRWQRLAADLTREEYLKLVPDGVHPNEKGAMRVTLPNVLSTLGVDEVEGAREIPVLADVDVLVVGGTFAAVSAAVAAKDAGASVFLAAPRRNLAEEIVLARRLTRPADDEPLEGEAFASLAFVQEAAPLVYSADAMPNASKPDPDGTKLTDGARSSAATESVQYDAASVTWTLAVSGDVSIEDLALYYYFRPPGGDFDVAGISVEASANGVDFTAASGTLRAAEEEAGLIYGDTCRSFTFVFAEPSSARHFRITATRAEGAKRMLVGEICAHTGVMKSRPLAPLVYEKALDASIAAAGVTFLGGLEACGVVRTQEGRVAGVVFADKSGRQVVRAKCVVDATEKGVVARRACALRPIADDNEVDFTFSLIAKAGLEFDIPGYAVEETSAPSSTLALATGGDASMIPSDAEKTYPISLYRLTARFPLSSGAWPVVNAIVQRMRSDTWTPSLADACEVPFYVTPERIVGRAAMTSWTSSAAAPMGAFEPAGVEGLYVLGPAADVDRDIAEKLVVPGVATALGRRVGVEAAGKAATLAAVGELQFGAASSTAAGIVVRERLARPLGIPASASAVCASQGGELPVLAVADVVVVGMGTAGAPAAIAALEKGCSVVGIEYLHTMGGVTTDGRIGKYYKGYSRGFTKQRLDTGVASTGWVYAQAKAEWMRRTVVSKGLAQVFFGSQVEGVVCDGADAEGRAKVTGVVMVMPDGTRGVVRAKVVIDATGNAEIAHMAGCETLFLDGREFAMQGSGTAYHVLGNSYFNTDFGFLNTDDAGDLSNFAWRARAGAKSTRYNVGDPSTGARERRRIVGDVVVNERDILRARRWRDTIMHGTSDYDMHGFSVSDVLMYRERPHGKSFSADLPYRALLPSRLAGVLATGLGISATRDAMPIIRMQRDVQNQGYAAGLAAAMAVGTGDVRTIDVRALQQELVAAGCLDARVLSEDDAQVTDDELAQAVASLTTADFAGLEKILERPDAARPLLAAAYAGAADDARRIALAVARALVGDAGPVLDDLVAAARTASWTDGFDFQGLGNYGRQTAPVDYLVHALAKSGDAARVVPVLRELVARLVDETGESARLSHVRLLTLAVEDLSSRELFEALEAAVARGTSLTGHARTSLAEVPANDADGGNNSVDDASRTKSLVELALARTLARGGSAVGATLLGAYSRDVRTIYASYAALALALPPLALTNALDEAGVDRYIHIEPTLVDDGDFEPVNALVTNNRAKQDARSVRDAAWLAANLPRWTFGPSDANGSGICNNGSYFSNGGQLAKLGASNRHAAFLRIADGVGPGRIAHAFEVPAPKTKVTVSCRIAGRYYDNKVSKGRVVLEVDGVRVTVSDLVDTWSLWPEFSATFTMPQAGPHMFAFVAVANGEGTCDILLDRVMIGYDIPRAWPFQMFVR